MHLFGLHPLLALCLLALLAPQGAAQTDQDKPVQVVVPTPAGGQPDALARQIVQKLDEKTGEKFVILNKSGASGIVGNSFAAKSPPDGRTLLIVPRSYITITPHVHLKMPYDSLNDLVPVVQIGTYGFVLVSHPGVPAKTVKELIALARAKPDSLTFGSPGIGNSLHISGELFKQMAGVRMLHVPFVGAPAAMNALMGGHVNLAFSSVLVAKPLAEAGKIHIIAVTGLTRDPLLPHIPTIDESGVSGYEVVDWLGMFVPKGTPVGIVERYNTMVSAILTTQEMKDLWASQGISFTQNTPTQFKTIVKDDYDRSGKLISAIGIKPE